MKLRARSGLLALALALAACSGPGEPPEGGGVPVAVDPHGETGPLFAPPGRQPKRLTVDMLGASVPVAAGPGKDGEPIRWRVPSRDGKRKIDGFGQDAYGGSLGRADYATVTEENMVPNALYAKLADDLARDVCGQMVVADLARSDPAARALTRFAGSGSAPEVAANVRYLVLRFLGEDLPEGHPELSALAKLYADVAAASAGAERPDMEGWRAVCVALVSSPAFHVY